MQHLLKPLQIILLTAVRTPLLKRQIAPRVSSLYPYTLWSFYSVKTDGEMTAPFCCHQRLHTPGCLQHHPAPALPSPLYAARGRSHNNLYLRLQTNMFDP